MSDGNTRTSRDTASSPPAEAPTTTMSWPGTSFLRRKTSTIRLIQCAKPTTILRDKLGGLRMKRSGFTAEYDGARAQLHRLTPRFRDPSERLVKVSRPDAKIG